MEIVYILVTLIIALSAGFFIGKIIFSSSANAEKAVLEEKINSLQIQISQNQNQDEEQKSLLKNQIELLTSEKETYRQDKVNLTIEITRKDADFENLYLKNKEQKAELTEIQEKFTKEFENLANKILEEKSLKFTEQNRNNIKTILDPLNEKIQLFEKKVEESQKENIGIHASLKEQLNQLKNQNLKITQEAENLTKALKGDSKTQGNWGELVLERVLEKSGLEKDREYFVQQSMLTDEGKRVMPDVIIYLPDNKKMIIDSKVSLTAYERYINEENEDKKNQELKDHTTSIKKHIEDLSSKNYQDLYRIESPDFILLFIPIEPAFASALNYDNALYNKAFEKNIVIVTPSTLLATLRTIDSIWTNQKQQENAYEIARLAGSLYDKFEGFVSDLLRVGKKMDEAKVEYGNAMNKLVDGRGNIVTNIQKLKKMGATAKKSIPESILKRAKIETEDDETDI